MRDCRTRVGELTFYSGIDDLSGASQEKKIRWFRERFKKVISRPLREVQRLGPRNPAIWDLNLIVVTVICSAVEALGSFYSPGVKDETAFDNFATEFMDPIYREKSPATGMTYARILYGQFRCGLAHGFTIEGHEVTTRPGKYLTDDDGYVSIDLWTLFQDMERASRKYLERVETDKGIRADFVRRFDKLFVTPYEK